MPNVSLQQTVLPLKLMVEKSAIINHKMERLLQDNSIDIPQKIVYLLVHWDIYSSFQPLKKTSPTAIYVSYSFQLSRD